MNKTEEKPKKSKGATLLFVVIIIGVFMYSFHNLFS